MPRAKRICARPGCPTPTADSLCPTHRAEAERKRGTTTQRGYGHAHAQQRKQWLPRIATGTVACARCGKEIQPGTPWALDHSDDRTQYIGPSHARCNNSAGGKAAHY